MSLTNNMACWKVSRESIMTSSAPHSSNIGKVSIGRCKRQQMNALSFLYSFQVRIGNMDGVMVAYHNTARMFGFQYIPLSEIDEAIFGTEPGVGDHIFNRCISLLESIAEEAISCFQQQVFYYFGPFFINLINVIHLCSLCGALLKRKKAKVL